MTLTKLTAAMIWALALIPGSIALQPQPAGQPCELPTSIVEAGSLSAEHERQIRDCVAANIKLLESDDRGEMRKGREWLLKPLVNPGASVSFRLEYTAAATAALERIAGGESEPRAINALIVAGALGTTQGAAVLDRFAQDQRGAVRYAAVTGFRRTFMAIEKATPAMTPKDAEGIVETLGRHVAGEEDANVLDAAVRGLVAAAELTRSEFAGVRTRALETLARAAVDRIHALPIEPASDAALGAMVRAGGALRDAAANVAQVNLQPATTRLILEFGAELWAHLVKRLEAGQFETVKADDPPEAADAKRAARALPRQVVQIGQATMFFAGSRLGEGRPFDPKQPAEWIGEAAQDGDAQFTRRARELIGPGGILTKPPFGYPADRFLPR